MRVLYDHQIFQLQKFGGISRYFSNLICAFNEKDNIIPNIAIRYSDNEYLNDDKLIPNYLSKNSKAISRKIQNFLHSQINKRNSIRHIRKNQFDLFHPTYYNDYFLKDLKKPFVLTVYDMIHEKYSQSIDQVEQISDIKRHLCNRASSIIAISKSTKKDLIELFGIPENKIFVTYLSGGFTKKIVNEKLKEILPSNYVLFVGQRSFYKNFDKFLEAMSILMEDDLTLSLVCTGKPFSSEEIRELKQKYNPSICDRIKCFYVNDNDLYTYYHLAKAFVFPSLYEGFGIPILESFSAGCPAIISNSSSLPEVGGTAAQYFDPESLIEMQNRIKNVLYNECVRSDMIKKGYEQLDRFGWELTASKTQEIYEMTLAK